VLGHPALVARNVGGDAQGEALFAQQRIAAIAGAVAPDLARFREVDDVLLFVAGPSNVFLAGLERRSSFSISASTGLPMRAMMRMFTTT
jgi:hypothetical protein